MKKLLTIAALAVAATTVSAAEVGVRTIRHDGKATLNGVTLNTKIGSVNTEFAYDRFSDHGFSINRVAALGVMPFTKAGDLTIAGKAGVAHLSPSVGDGGFAAMYGIGTSYPLTKTVSLAVDVMYMKGQSKISAVDGPSVSAGLKVAF